MFFRYFSFFHVSNLYYVFTKLVKFNLAYSLKLSLLTLTWYHMARKRYISQDEWDDYLDWSDSHSEDFSDLSDSEHDVHALYVASDTDESSLDEDKEAAIVQPPVPLAFSLYFSADSTAVAAATSI